jgi:EAL and modified HD-GYP domain-containing signal transduction protein
MDVFVARQAIFDRQLRVFGYELLFRSGPQNVFPMVEASAATSRVLDTGMVSGLETLAAGKPAFVNFPRELLLGGQATLLPPEHMVVEILEDVELDDDVAGACRRLRRDGYRLALDDYVGGRGDRFVDLVDIVKVDFLLADRARRRGIVERLAPTRVLMLAEKVETQEEFDEARSLGFTYFQGYFFAKPLLLTRRGIPPVNLGSLRILDVVHREPLDFGQVEDAVKADLALSYRLLRLINSAALGRSQPITSIHQALVLLGELEVRKWVSIAVLSELTRGKSDELLTASALRARLCETLGRAVGMGEQHLELFLTGMFSLIDAVVDRPLEQALGELPLPPRVCDALLGQPNRLRSVLDATVAYEHGDWPALSLAAERLGIAEDRLVPLFVEAVGWAGSLSQG